MKRFSNQTILLTAAFALALSLSVVAIIKVMSLQSIVENLSKTVVQPSQNIQPAPLQIGEIDTSTWKTYRNEQYGFEIRYPEDWIVEERKGIVSFESPQTKQAREDNMRNCSDDSPNTVCRLDFGPIDILFYENVPTFVTQPSSKMKTVIDNIAFERYEADLPPDYHDVYYETSANGKVYLFRAAPDKESILTGLLSTFKFIPSTGSTSSP